MTATAVPTRGVMSFFLPSSTAAFPLLAKRDTALLTGFLGTARCACFATGRTTFLAACAALPICDTIGESRARTYHALK